MTLRLIPVSSITTHWELNRPKDEHHVHALARHLNEDGYNQQFPLRVVIIGDNKHLAAGHHRLAAASLSDITYPNLPLPEVWAEEKDGTMDDVIRIMQEDNLRHDPAVNASVGLPLTRQQKTSQCKALLMFSEYFGKSSRALEKLFGVHHQTITRWKQEVSVTLRQIADVVARAADADAKSAVLTEFAMSESRLTEMICLIETGEREVTRGGTTYTQKTVASEVKKKTEREEAIESFRNASKRIRGLMEEIGETFPSHRNALTTIRRRLFAHFDMAFTENASKWALPAIRTELGKQLKLINTLTEDSLWTQELKLHHDLNVLNEELTNMGGPYRLPEVQTARREMAKLATSDWEVKPQTERLEGLRRLARLVPDLVKQEVNQRKLEKQRRDLEASRKGASAACSRLAQTFHHSAIEDKSERGYREFIVAACELGGYSSKPLIPELFLLPENIDVEDMGHRIRSIADKIRLDLGSAHQPPWMQSFLPSRAPQFQPKTEPTPAPAPEPEPEPPPVRQPKPPPEPKSLASQLGYDMNLVGKKMRDAANAIGADLPADVRCPAWTVNLIQEHLKKRVPNRIEQVDALRAVMLRLAKELIDEDR